jgi:hypothetical protein
MAAFLNACRFIPTAGGTTDWTYSTAATGYQSPAAANVVNGRVYKYRAESADLSQWEIGEGAYNTGAGVLARTTVLFNSAGTTAKINFSTVPQVAVVALKEDLLSIEEANSFTAAQQKQARENIGCSTGIPDVIIEDRKASGTHGGSATSGSPPIRDLNTLVRNAGTIASLSGNQFTLGAGTYFIAWSAPAWRVDQHQTILRNVTDTANVAVGTTAYSPAASDTAVTNSFGSAVVTIAGVKAFAIQHAVTVTRATTGYAVAGSFGVGEVYTRVEVTKLS